MKLNYSEDVNFKGALLELRKHLLKEHFNFFFFYQTDLCFNFFSRNNNLMENLLRKFWKYFMYNMYNTVHSTVLESIAVSVIDI